MKEELDLKSKSQKKGPIYAITKRSVICDLSEALYFIFGYFLYVAAFVPIAYMLAYAPEYDTKELG